MYQYEYERPAMTVDVVVFSGPPTELKVLLIRRGGEPFKGRLALPGGYVDIGQKERCIEAAARELNEEAGITKETGELIQVGLFDEPDRNPLGRVMSMAYYTFVDDPTIAKAGDDAVSLAWYDLGAVLEMTDLAFDHGDIIRTAANYFK